MHDDESYFKPPGGYDNDQNNELAELVMNELENIARRRDLLKAKNKIQDEHVSDGIEVALSGEERGLTTEVDEKLSEVSSENRSINELKQAYEEYHEETKKVFERNLEAWRSDVRRDLEDLVTISQNADEAERLLKELEKHIKNELSAFRQAQNPNQVSVQFNFGRFSELNDKLDSLGVGTVDEGVVIDSLNHLEKAGKAFIAGGSSSVVDKLKSAVGSNPDEERKATYFRRVDKVDEDIFEVGGWESPDFICKVNDDFVESKMNEIERREQELINSVADSLNQSVMSEVDKEDIIEEIDADSEMFDDVGGFGTETNHSSSLREWLKNEDLASETADTVLENLCSEDGRDNIVYEAFYDSYLSSIEGALNEVEAELSEYQKEVDKYRELGDIIDEEGEAFVNDRDDVEDPSGIRIEAISGTESSHRRDETAVQRGRLQRVNDIEEAGLWSDDNPEERQKIAKNLNDFAQRVATLGDYAPLRNGNIESNRSEYDDVEYTHRLFNVYMSRMFEDNKDKASISEDILTVEETLTNSIRVDKTDDHWTESKVKSGAPWDVAMTTFIGGVFLDNLSIVTDPNQGYKTTYEAELEAMDDHIVIRHTHGIDGKDRHIRDVTQKDGGWIHRGKVINTRVDDQLGLILSSRDEGDTIERLIDEYMDINGISSTQPVNWAD
jgi:hypothetical protein